MCSKKSINIATIVVGIIVVLLVGTVVVVVIMNAKNQAEKILPNMTNQTILAFEATTKLFTSISTFKNTNYSVTVVPVSNNTIVTTDKTASSAINPIASTEQVTVHINSISSTISQSNATLEEKTTTIASTSLVQSTVTPTTATTTTTTTSDAKPTAEIKNENKSVTNDVSVEKTE